MQSWELEDQTHQLFTDPTRSTEREAILMQKLLFDLKFAAAKSGYHLRTYVVDVDNHGYDVVLDDGLRTKKLQVKTVLNSAKTSYWKVQAGVLQPAIHELTATSMWLGERAGVGGGFVLMIVKPQTHDVEVQYRYCDLGTITLQDIEWLGTKQHSQMATTLLGKLNSRKYEQKVEVRRSNLVKLKDPECLLSLTGLKSRLQMDWRHEYRWYFGDIEASKNCPSEQGVKDQLNKLIV